ncbi:hypothetical protein PENARI_c001G06330 [Penicillium arizonense]|uniref:Uncharacterized protein n=1 Tax=Penicillium arizonense TaxID=1835702 RepID=A0A1F5LXT5_PENAI|nr:hypothetical protein PENARI_c001G06330 [Penicillium arizonense]OGE57789.1 hypothetical protein PENARI_c001G06330 [Penicillium arizonense]
MDITHPEGSIEREVERKRLDFVSKILMVGSDFQSTLGIAYLVTTFAQVSIMDTYHLHLVFDIASFVGVSNTAALVCWRYCRAKIDEPDMKLHHEHNIRISWFNNRYRAVYIFVALYLALTILLGIRLNEWAPHQEPGRCYYSTLVTDPSDSHPTADKYYVGFTSAWLIIVVLASVFAGVKRRRTILVLSSLHFPLHLYMTIALRQANQGKLEGKTSHENEWDFGQTTAVMLLVITLVELLQKGKEYYDFESHVAKHGVPPSANYRAIQRDEEANRSSSLLVKGSGDKNMAEGRRSAMQEHTSS